MPSGFVLPVFKITRQYDGLSTVSNRQGGIAEIARFYSEPVETFKSRLKSGWNRHVDTGDLDFVFELCQFDGATDPPAVYHVRPLLTQSELPTSQFVHLTSAQLDVLTKYLREAKTNATATTYSVSRCMDKIMPTSACYSPDTIEVDLHSDMFRVTFAAKRPRSDKASSNKERYYLSVATMDQ